LTSSSSPPFVLQVELNADDYRQYFALIGKRQSTWSNSVVYLIAIFAAVPVALLFRLLASLEIGNRDAIELVGLCSLIAYVAGLIALNIAGWIIRRRSIADSLAGTPNAFAPKTVVIDADAVSISGALSDVRWTWAAFTHFTVTQGLLCLWIGPQGGVIIAARAFPSDDARRSAIAFIQGKLDAAKKAA